LVNLLDIIGDKWSLIIVRDLFQGKKTFGEFLLSPEKISTTVLTSRLKFLEIGGIIDHVLSKKDKKVKFYYLTDKGIDLFPVIYEMKYWSVKNLDKECHQVSQKGFKNHQSGTSEVFVQTNQNNYLELRKELLNA
jgi:DNA-binding HxlR family transcriptional regulator